MEKVRSSVIVPRNYCLCYQQGDTKVYISPFSHILGNGLRASPEVLGKRLKYAQKYNRRYRELEKEGGVPYEPKFFPWPEDLLNEKDIFEVFRGAVKKTEGVYNLVDTSPGDAIRDLKLMGKVLTGRVKSKEARTNEKEGQTHNYYHVMIKSPFLDEFGEPEIIAMGDSCPDYSWCGTKGSNVKSIVECMHIAAIEQEFWEQVYTPNPLKRGLEVENRKDLKKGKRRGLFSPFTFSRNWGWDTESRRYLAKNRNLQVLEDDARIAHYVLEEGHFDINHRLLRIPEVLSPMSMGLLGRGMMTFEVLAQNTKKLPSSRKVHSENALFTRLRGALAKYGYVPDGKYLELGESAWRYRHGDNVVGIVFSEDLPPFCVVKQGFNGPVKLWAEDKAETDPFKLVGKRDQYRHDDKTKKWTRHRVEMPSALRLPETGFKPIEDFSIPKDMRRRWKAAIQRSNPEGSEGKQKYCRVFY